MLSRLKSISILNERFIILIYNKINIKVIQDKNFRLIFMKSISL